MNKQERILAVLNKFVGGRHIQEARRMLEADFPNESWSDLPELVKGACDTGLMRKIADRRYETEPLGEKMVATT